jgi:hypothetical protein
MTDYNQQPTTATAEATSEAREKRRRKFAKRIGDNQMTINEIEAKHGDKMVEITIRFWTDKITEEEGKILPKHINNSGTIRISANKTHGIPTENPTVFDSITELPAKIEELLERHKIVVHY